MTQNYRGRNEKNWSPKTTVDTNWDNVCAGTNGKSSNKKLLVRSEEQIRRRSRMFKESRCHQTTKKQLRFISYHHRMTKAHRSASGSPPLVKLKETLHQAGGIEVRIQPQWCFSEKKQLTQEKHRDKHWKLREKCQIPTSFMKKRFNFKKVAVVVLEGTRPSLSLLGPICCGPDWQRRATRMAQEIPPKKPNLCSCLGPKIPTPWDRKGNT